MTTEESHRAITPDTILLDIVSKWPTTETVFRRYDEAVGVCLCCTCLFDSLEEIAARHGLDLKQLIRELQKEAFDRNPL